MSIKLILRKSDIAANLQAYGEPEIASRIASLTDTQYDSLCEVGGKLSLEGKKFAEAACLAAIYVVEGRSRLLRNSRRNWSLVEPALLEPDPVMMEIDQWIARYADGDYLPTTALVESIREALAPQLPEFKYFKSKRCFRRKTAYGWQQIGIEASQRSGLSFRFGVRHDDVEAAENEIRSWTPNKVTADFPTISKWSVNMGPNHRYWKHHIYPVWPIGGHAGLAVALPEIERFLEEIMLPFMDKHSHIENLRETFLERPLTVDEMGFAATLFAVDLVACRADRLDGDYLRIKSLFQSWGASEQLKIAEYLERAKQLGMDTYNLDN